MRQFANRVVTCAICGNNSTNQYGTAPFDNLYQLEQWPTLFFHVTCGEDMRKELDSLGLPLTSRFSRMFCAGAVIETEVKESANEYEQTSI
jgi:hypothetical protein